MKPPARAIRLLQRVARLQLVDARRTDLAFERDQARLARDRHADVLLAVDRDHVARQQLDVVGPSPCRIALPRLNGMTWVVRSARSSRSITA